MSYTLELYHCDGCGLYPIKVHRRLPQGTVVKGATACPRCGGTKLTFEKVYRADEEGRIVE